MQDLISAVAVGSKSSVAEHGVEEVIGSNPTALIFKKLVTIYDHGLNIFKVRDEGLDMVSVPGDNFESEGCIAFPWARKAIQVRESCCMIINYLLLRKAYKIYV